MSTKTKSFKKFSFVKGEVEFFDIRLIKFEHLRLKRTGFEFARRLCVLCDNRQIKQRLRRNLRLPASKPVQPCVVFVIANVML